MPVPSYWRTPEGTAPQGFSPISFEPIGPIPPPEAFTPFPVEAEEETKFPFPWEKFSPMRPVDLPRPYRAGYGGRGPDLPGPYKFGPITSPPPRYGRQTPLTYFMGLGDDQAEETAQWHLDNARTWQGHSVDDSLNLNSGAAAWDLAHTMANARVASLLTNNPVLKKEAELLSQFAQDRLHALTGHIDQSMKKRGPRSPVPSSLFDGLSAEDMGSLEVFMALGELGTSPVARAWISKKVRTLIKEGYGQKQSAAIAYNMARKRGMKVSPLR